MKKMYCVILGNKVTDVSANRPLTAARIAFGKSIKQSGFADNHTMRITDGTYSGYVTKIDGTEIRRPR